MKRIGSVSLAPEVLQEASDADLDAGWAGETVADQGQDAVPGVASAEVWD